MDFIYATVKGATKPAADKTQKINFRHALSQIEFAAINENTKIHVEISSVSVMNVYNKGNFEFPTESTVNNIPGTVDGNIHNPLPSDQTIEKQGTWTVTTTSTDSYTANLGTPAVVVKSTSTSLTVTDPADQEWNPNTMYLMPYGKKAIDPALGVYIPIWDGTGKATESDEAYFQIKAQIWNVAATTDATPGTFDPTTDLVLYNGDIAVKMPDNTVWEQGKRYVYTFIFTPDGNGGYNPDPTNPSTPEPVLVPIKLSVTVDDFVDGGTVPDIEMKKP